MSCSSMPANKHIKVCVLIMIVHTDAFYNIAWARMCVQPHAMSKYVSVKLDTDTHTHTHTDMMFD